MKLVAILATIIIGTMAVVVSANTPVNLTGCDYYSQWCLTPDGWVSLKVATPTPMPTATPEPTPTATPTPGVWIEYDEPIQFTPNSLAIRGALHGASTSDVRAIMIVDSDYNMASAIMMHPPEYYTYTDGDRSNIVKASDWAIAGEMFYFRGYWRQSLADGNYLAIVVMHGESNLHIVIDIKTGNIVDCAPCAFVVVPIAQFMPPAVQPAPPSPATPTPVPFCFPSFPYGYWICW